ncbi:MAG: transposase [Planktothrix sp.]
MTENQYKRKTTSVSLINYHFVFCPKRRKKVFVNEVSRRLEEIIY